MEADAPGPFALSAHAVCGRRGFLLAGTAGLLGLAGCRSEPPRGPARPAAGPGRAAVDALLEARSRAVLERDAEGFLATVHPDEPGFRARQEELFTALSRLPFGSWRESVERLEGTLATLRLAYRYRDFDTGDVVLTTYLELGRAGGGWLVTGDGGDREDAPESWTDPDVRAVRGESCLVVGRGPLEQVADRLDRCVPAVTAVVGSGWARRAVALLPGDADRAEELAGGRSFEGIAAAATATRNADGSPGQARILVSPEGWPRLNPLGRRVVLTHELTHVAMESAGDERTPMWLVEGFADHVAYRATGTPPAVAARELAEEVARGELPDGLPSREDFATGAPRLSQAYQEAWMACRMVAGRYGEDRLLRLYREAGRRSERDALRDVLGVEDLTGAWREYLRGELG
ncbi:gluzincin family metallopeptidase [Actinocorallia populi]|uniref:hypothetical protein n=1 Tax=Actinocorallia populi TaxID=2079200 RepID=UPI000D096A9B|nr:hypothetical protein [Actinocorallia populi]